MINLICGDSLEELKKLQENSIDSIVTDPPYGLSAARNSGKTSKGGFMGKKWDYDVPQVELWRECLRVLKPGGHMLAFAGTRTQHRMAVNIEDAGFELRDVIVYVYGSGFPKSQNISKQIDKVSKRLDLFQPFAKHFKIQRVKLKLSQKDISKHFPSKTGGLTGCVWNWENAESVPTKEQFKILKPLLDLSDEFLSLIERAETEREIIDKQYNIANKGNANTGRYNWNTESQQRKNSIDITAPATEAAKQWDGWGTALKPAMEMISVCRKPLSEKTVAANVLKWGTGGINIDQSRVETSDNTGRDVYQTQSWKNTSTKGVGSISDDWKKGRWPANLIHDGSEEVVGGFPQTKSGSIALHHKRTTSKTKTTYGARSAPPEITYGDQGSAARFFYCAKASKSERGEGNNHPTVKPLKLMQYLVKLVTAPGGTVLDPFAGSGTTGIACVNNDFDFIGIEIDRDYIEIARSRIKASLI